MCLAGDDTGQVHRPDGFASKSAGYAFAEFVTITTVFFAGFIVTGSVVRMARDQPASAETLARDAELSCLPLGPSPDSPGRRRDQPRAAADPAHNFYH